MGDDPEKKESEIKDKDEIKMSDVERLKKSASASKGWITRILGDLENLFSAETTDVAAISVALESLTLRENKLIETHDELCMHLDGIQMEQEIDDVKENYLDKIASVKKKFMECGTKVLPENAAVPKSRTRSDSGSGGSCEASGGHRHRRTRLPKVTLKTYDGDFLRFYEWWQPFEDLVHNDSDVSETEKFAHLDHYLKGDAAKAISSVPRTKNNYPVAIDILRRRFGKPKMIKDTVYRKIQTLPILKDTDDVKSLRDFVDEVEIYVRALENIGIKSEEYSSWFLSVVEQKIPSSWKIQFARSIDVSSLTDDNFGGSFEEFMDFLRKEIVIRERAMLVVGAESESSSRSNRFKSDVMSASSLVNKVSEPSSNTNRRRFPCIFCGSEDHIPRFCQAQMTAESRFQKVSEGKACMKCGWRNHRRANCQWRGRCSHCKGDHISQLCQASSPPAETKEKTEQSDKGATKIKTSLGIVGEKGDPSTSVLLRTCSFKVNGVTQIRALLDCGCSRSFIRADVAAQVGAEYVGKKKVSIDFYRGGNIVEEFEVVKVRLMSIHTFGADNSSPFIEVEAFVDEKPVGLFDLLSPQVADFVGSLGYYPLADSVGTTETPIGMILGEDVIDRVMTGATRYVNDSLKVTPSIFGWLVHGETSLVSSAGTKNYFIRAKEEGPVDELRSFWDLEHIGIIEEPDTEQREMILSQIKRSEDGRYESGWPWKESLYPAVNRQLAMKRLERLQNSLSSEKMTMYQSAIQEMIDEGFAEEAPASPDGKILSYLPHRPVFKQSSESYKTRPVFDASAKSRGTFSLNECLYKGPNLLQNVFDMLLRFRLKRVAIIGDLARAFLMILLKKEDRDSCRFLWNNKEYRMTRILFGVTCSPAILQLVIEKHLTDEKKFIATAMMLKDCIFMDDVVNSLDSDEQALRFWDESVEIFDDAKMTLRKLRSSSVEIENTRKVDGPKVDDGPVLGVNWNSRDDTLQITLKDDSVLTVVQPITKRQLVSIMSSVFDPMGLIAPVLTPFKIIVQDIWLKKIGWDDKLDEEFIRRVNPVIEEIRSALTWKIPRWVGYVSTDQVELHVFSDSSGRTYAACVYIRIIKGEESIVHLLACKAKLIQTKWLEKGFTPRYELLGCYIGALLEKGVRKSLGFDSNVKSFFWTDSMICLNWITGDLNRLERFVRNRVITIRESVGIWQYVNTKENPADIPTRELGLKDLSENDLWWYGPVWLKKDSSFWPQGVYKSLPEEIVYHGAIRANETNQDPINEFINPRTSKWRILVRAVCRIKRLKSKISGDISSIEERNAVLSICVQLQKSMCVDKLKTLEPFVDTDGLIRLGGRLQKSDSLTYDEKHPIVLSRCGAVDLLVLKFHQDLCHAGPSIVLVELRKAGFWILRGKKVVSSVLRSCRKCCRFIAKPCVEKTPPFPNQRVTFTSPFNRCGVDLGGPLYLIDNTKVWFAVFTCLEIRAVHLEVVRGLSEDDFIRCLNRFISRRCVPTEIWSDHGSNFVAVSRKLKEKGINIVWRFIVERAPWWGGVWERLVGLTKGLLKRELGKELLSYEELETVLIQIENVLNRRPITFTWETCVGGNCPIPLCPIDFLNVKSNNSGQNNEIDVLSYLSCQKTIMTQLKSVWKEQYLMCVLGSSGKIWKDIPRVPVLGEVVLIGDTMKKRQTWDIGVVVHLFRASDGGIRAVTLRKMTNGKIAYINRPIRLIYPLEIQCDTVFDLNSEEKITDDIVDIVDTNDIDDDDIEDMESDELDVVVTDRRGRKIQKPARFLD